MRSEIWQLLDSRGLGGIETHVAILCSELRDRGFLSRVVFLQDHGPHPLGSRLARHGIPTDTLVKPNEIAARLKCDRPMLLHTHGYKSGVIGRLSAQIASVPVVSTFHNGDKGQGRLRLYTALDRITGPLGQQIAVSEDIGRQLVGRVNVIENFVPLPRFSFEDSDRRIVAFAGRLSPEKGPDLFCQLAETLPDLEFHAYGDGPMRIMLEARYGHIVKFFGMVEDLHQRFSDIGLLCMTSRAEGLPMVALEAMAAQVPVAAFSVGGLTRLISDGESGWLVPKTDLSIMRARILEHFAAPSERRLRMGRSSRSTIESRFSPKTQITKICDVYEAALRRPLAKTLAEICRVM